MRFSSTTASEREARSFARDLKGVPVFVVSGLSKIAGLPQMKAAWIVATGPERKQALERLEVIADTFLSMNAPVQWALPEWLACRAAIQEQIRRRVAANLALLDRSACRRCRQCSGLLVEGGWYAVLRIPALEPDEQTVLALLERGVWVHPGYFFGMPESGWLVVSLLAPEPEFSTGVGILIDYFRTNHGGNITGLITGTCSSGIFAVPLKSKCLKQGSIRRPVLQKRIAAALFADGGCGAVAGQNMGFIGQSEKPRTKSNR